MSKSLKKGKQYCDSQLFVDGMIFLKESMFIMNNLCKDYKIQYGNNFIIDIRDMLTCFAVSYKHKNIVEKLQYGHDAYRLIEKIDISLRIMSETGIITEKQNARLSVLIGNLIIQTKGWINSIGGKTKNDDVLEIDENED